MRWSHASRAARVLACSRLPRAVPAGQTNSRTWDACAEGMHMARDLPALDLLRGFEAAARHLSFTKAGEELFLTQSAISRQVQALEEQLGVKLFHRRTRALLLTDEGQRYLQGGARRARRPARGYRLGPVVPRGGDAHRQHDADLRFALARAQARRLPERAARASRSGSSPRTGCRTSTARASTSRCVTARRRWRGRGAIRLFGERVLPVVSPKVAGAPEARSGPRISRGRSCSSTTACRTPFG